MKCFKANGRGKMKEFYFKAIVFLIKSNTFDQLKKVLVKILVVASLEYDGNKEGTTNYTEAEKFKEIFLKKIENNDFKENLYTSDHDDIEDENEIIQNNRQTLNHSNKMDEFIKKIKEHVSVLSNSQGDRLNAYFCRINRKPNDIYIYVSKHIKY